METTNIAIPARRLRDRRIVVLLVLLIALCLTFWLSSRYPSLDAKAGADPQSVLATPLGFDRHFNPPADNTSSLLRIGHTWIEWVETNRQGMVFGILIATVILTLTQLWQAGPGSTRFASLKGALLGAPLGICVNCVAPLGVTMMRSGHQPQTVLAMMISSPSLNIVVLGMMVAMLPAYLVALKLASVAAFIFIVAPIAVRLAPITDVRKMLDGASDNWMSNLNQWLNPLTIPTGAIETRLGHALTWVARHLLTNTLKITVLVVPLMALAGLIGAIAVELVPWGAFLGELSTIGPIDKLGVIFCAALFGTLLPVPIAFDVMICAMLFGTGVPAYVVSTLFVTLGAFSVYPWLLLGNYWSWRLANLVVAALVVLGVTGGISGHFLNEWNVERQKGELIGLLTQHAYVPPSDAPAFDSLAAADITGLISKLPECENTAYGAYCPDRTTNQPQPNLAFLAQDGTNFGLTYPIQKAAIRATLHPDQYYTGVAKGDTNRDGWEDILIGTGNGPALFTNIGGRFVRQAIGDAVPLLAETGPVALIDLNQDGWSDLVWGTEFEGAFLLLNQAGDFSNQIPQQILPANDFNVIALGFADFDKNGLLDVVAGTTHGSRNQLGDHTPPTYVLRQTEAGFEVHELPGIGGATLTLFVHDLNKDHWPDLIVGNDFNWPEEFYLNSRGTLAPALNDNPHLWPYTTKKTMSFDIGQLEARDNPTIYAAQVAFGRMDDGHLEHRMLDPEQDCAIYQDTPPALASCKNLASLSRMIGQARSSANIKGCLTLSDQISRSMCAFTTGDLIFDRPNRREKLCAMNRLAIPEIERHCSRYRNGDDNLDESSFPRHAQQVSQRNLSFERVANGWQDVTSELETALGTFSWNSQYADLDQDGFLDLLVSNGFWKDKRHYRAVFYRGNGRHFERQEPEGLDSHLPGFGHITMDFDRDGDLDIISIPAFTPPLVFEATKNKGRGLTIAFDTTCISTAELQGARIDASIADHVMTRFLPLSGGYNSHHGTSVRFGLGAAAQLDQLSITLIDGTQFNLDAEFAPGLHRVCLATGRKSG